MISLARWGKSFIFTFLGTINTDFGHLPRCNALMLVCKTARDCSFTRCRERVQVLALACVPIFQPMPCSVFGTVKTTKSRPLQVRPFYRHFLIVLQRNVSMHYAPSILMGSGAVSRPLLCKSPRVINPLAWSPVRHSTPYGWSIFGGMSPKHHRR